MHIDVERIARGSTHRARRLWAKRPGSACYCVVCENRVAEFGPYRGGWAFAPDLMVALRYTAGDYDNCICPSCGSVDRIRHLKMYLASSTVLDGISGGTVVHFAPEPTISAMIEQRKPATYIRCDIAPSAPGVVPMDMLDITQPDKSVDLLIANHVLEHVPDTDLALAEVVRVLKPGGFAILQTPFCQHLNRTWEDAAITTDAQRLAAFGQEDHVRLFGTDVFDRISASGLESLVVDHREALATVDPVVHGVDAEEPFFLFRKP